MNDEQKRLYEMADEEFDHLVTPTTERELCREWFRLGYMMGYQDAVPNYD